MRGTQLCGAGSLRTAMVLAACMTMCWSARREHMHRALHVKNMIMTPCLLLITPRDIYRLEHDIAHELLRETRNPSTGIVGVSKVSWEGEGA